MIHDYYSYKKDSFTCGQCGWTGPGSEADLGEMYNDGFELDCPKCHERFPGLILFPKIEETLEKGSIEEKHYAGEVKSFREKRVASLLTDISQLPELQNDSIVFVLKEAEEDGENYIIIAYQNTIIWKEIRAYEYYERFIEIGTLLKQKYGDKMVDLVPEVDGLYLYGDNIFSVAKVEEFRKWLR